MTIALKREKLVEYIQQADERKVKAIYTILEREISTEYNWWEDEDFVAQLDREMADIKSGKSKTYTWEEVQAETKRLRTKRYDQK
ncbi:MAG: hypothetical protein J7539_02035 [Niabella sp.]|nr:hypothetical protein [Niabella sp.]